jgi:hypothetical protein
MILISHRGNINGKIPEYENNPDYVDSAINLGYDVEIDIRMINGELFLGHDTPDTKISLNWLEDKSKHLWIHTKNFEAMDFLIDFEWAKIFYHQQEAHTIINNTNLIWSHNLIEANTKSIIPLLSLNDISKWEKKEVYGICSDYIKNFKEWQK